MSNYNGITRIKKFSDEYIQEISKELRCVRDNIRAKYIERTFSMEVLKLIEEKSGSGIKGSKDFYRRTQLGREILYQIRTDADYQPSLTTVVSVCMGYEKSFEESADLIDIAHYCLRDNNEVEQAYKYLLKNFMGMSIDDCNAALNAAGYGKYLLGSSKSYNEKPEK